MRQYAGWQAPFYSFWSKGFYIDVAKHWHGLAYGYLLVLICFTWVFMAIKMQIDFGYIAQHYINPVIQQMPTITIEKGILSIDRPSPLTLKQPDGQTVITFDTRDKPMALAEAPTEVLVTSKAIFIKNPDAENTDNKTVIKGNADSSNSSNLSGNERSSLPFKSDANEQKSDAAAQKIDLSSVDHAVINQQSTSQAISDFKKSVGFFAFIIGVPLGFIFCAGQSLIYGLLALNIAKIYKVEMTYGTLIRLATIAMTPVLLIDSLLKVRNVYIPNSGVFALIITFSYLIFAVQANISDAANKPPDSVL